MYYCKLYGKEYINRRLLYEGEYLYNKKWNGKGYNESGEISYEFKNGTGTGTEFYDNGKLEFEGEYLNGKMHGKGKEYYDTKSNITYQLKNGNGVVKEYDNYGVLLFEGEYLNGEKNGKGKEYNNYGELLFEGEYLNNKKHGKGKEYGNLKFEGEYFQGKRWNGNGCEDNFSGEYLNGKWWNGRGKTSETFEYDRSEHGTAYKKWKIKVLKFYSNGNLSVSRFSEPVSLEEDL